MLCPLEFGNSMKAIVSKNVVKDLLMVDRVGTDFQVNGYTFGESKSPIQASSTIFLDRGFSLPKQYQNSRSILKDYLDVWDCLGREN